MSSTYIYVASSWRNPFHSQVLNALSAAGLDHYDFKNPPNRKGFSWRDVQPPGVCDKCGSDNRDVRREGWHSEYDVPMLCPGAFHGIPGKGSDWESVGDYLAMVNHPVAVAGFAEDFAAMKRADTFVLVLPCGKSAHLELGWAVGAGKRTAILLEDPVEPELMYRMVDHMATTVDDLLAWLVAE